MAVEAQGYDGEDELDGAKRKVEVKHVDGVVVNWGLNNGFVREKKGR